MSRLISRRDLLHLAGGASVSAAAHTAWSAPPAASLFDGHSLDGWIQIENSATAFSSASISDPAAFAAHISAGADPVSSLLRGHMGEPLRSALASFDLTAAAAAKATLSDLLKNLNQLIGGAPLYSVSTFESVALRPETANLLTRNPSDPDLVRLNKLLIEDSYPTILVKSGTTGWVVKDGALASTGSGRGVIYTAADYSRFRFMFTLRHTSGNPDHQPCVLIFCTRPKLSEKALDALAGIQFQAPNGGHWDYRPGKNNAGNDLFTSLSKTRFDNHEWSRVELLADASNGTARMAVAHPPGEKAIEMTAFHDPTAGRPGPIALQMHNAGLFDEYKDLSVEPDPQENRLLTIS